MQVWLLLPIPVWLNLECKIGGKSRGSTEVMALVKPLPSLPRLSQHHLPQQRACSPGCAMCHCELISSHHTRVPGRWTLLMPGVLTQAITPAAGHSLWPAANSDTGRSGFSENEPGTSTYLFHCGPGTQQEGFQVLGVLLHGWTFACSFQVLNRVDLVQSAHNPAFDVADQCHPFDRCLSNPASACSCLKLITGSRNCSSWCSTFPVPDKTLCCSFMAVL